MSTRCSVWLIPSESHRTELQDTITKCCIAVKRPSFIPHITLGSGYFNGLPSFLANTSFNTSIRVRLNRFELGKTVNMSAYMVLSFQDDTILEKLLAQFASQFERFKRPDKWHISLAYGELDIRQKSIVSGYAEKHVGSTVSLNSIYFVDTVAPMKSATSVELWKIIQKNEV